MLPTYNLFSGLPIGCHSQQERKRQCASQHNAPKLAAELACNCTHMHSLAFGAPGTRASGKKKARQHKAFWQERHTLSACTVPMGPRPPPPWPPRSPPITHPHTRHIHTHARISHTYTLTHTQTHTHTHKHTRTLSHTDTHAHTCTHIHTNANKNANIRTHNDTSMQTHTRMHILTHTNTHTAVKRWSCCREAPTHTRRIT